MKIALEVDWAYIGALFANASDAEQGQFFTAMAKEMSTWPTNFQREMQMHSAGEHTSDEAKHLLTCVTFKAGGGE